LELASVWPSARLNDCSRETLQCVLRCDDFVEDQVRAVKKRAASSTPYTNLCPGDRRRHSKDNSCVV